MKLSHKLFLTGLAVAYVYFPLLGFLHNSSTIVLEGPHTNSSGIIVYAKEASSVTHYKSLEDEIKAYIAEVFGKDAKIATAVGLCESGLVPDKVFHWGDDLHPNRGEWSVGVFQINLASNDGKGAHIHWNKAKGGTLEEKTEWLKDFKNNIDTAKKIFDTSGFYPWTGFTNGCWKTKI